MIHSYTKNQVSFFPLSREEGNRWYLLGRIEEIVAAHHHGFGKGRLAQKGFGVRTPDLHFDNVLDVGGNGNGLIMFVTLDRQAIQQMGIPLRVDYLPMRSRRIGNLEVLRPSQHIGLTFLGQGGRPHVGLDAFKFIGGHTHG